MNYTHLTQDERYQIAILNKAGHDQSEIAQLMNRHPSTISRELRRNRGKRGYRPRKCHDFKTPHEVFMKQLHSRYNAVALQT